ncbi:TIGR01777 family oxidoreductase [Rothia nasimurium]|uniref:TIGR01777 family oxidoreductase n=1 Tax=Rothia nasimurium TaxID=85336 RepID=UPI001F01704C|nr:TIGR01777 family oxidoreductase [Rothia nasimurium]
MADFTYTAAYPYDEDTVRTWFVRPGALTRATPHWAGSVTEEGKPNEPGSTAHTRVALPLTSGLLTLPWTARHTRASADSFTDEMVRGPLSSWEHTHDFLPTPGDTVVRDSITFTVLPTPPARAEKVGAAAERLARAAAQKQLEKVFAARERRIGADLDFQQRYESDPLTVVVAGASGMVGRQVVALLTGGGHTVRTLVRRAPEAEHEFRWDPSAGEIDTAAFEGADAVIHLGGASINQRFTEENKKKILDSRVESTTLLATTLAELVQQRGADAAPQVFVCASAVGIYGTDRGDEALTEEDSAGRGFLAQVCQAWEAACQPAREAGLRVVNVRTGLVQSALGGMLRLQLPAFLSGTGGWIGSGEQVQSWISLDDIAGIYVHAVLTEKLEGPVNAVAPTPVTAKALAKTVGKVLRRPVLLPIPPAVPALALGQEGVKELALASQRASADKLLASGYVFFEPELEQALAHELVR